MPLSALACLSATNPYPPNVSPLEVSDDESWLAALGVVPETEQATGDELVRELKIPVTDDEEVQLTWDITDSSVRLRYHRHGKIVTDLHRETAMLLTVTGRGPASEVIIEYGATALTGRTRVQLRPEVRIEDSVLRA
jgi:hypothetical protein